MGITILCGLAFLVVKYFEYTAKFHHGYFPSTNTFLGIYFTLTGLHGLHVIGGMVVLTIMLLRARRGRIVNMGSISGRIAPPYLGAYAASRRRTGRDFGIRLFGNVAYCIPVFWMGLMLQLVFGIWLNLLPIAGRTGPRVYASEFQKTGFYLLDTLIAGQWASFGDVAVHLLLPSLTLGIVLSGIFIRLTRANMLDTLKADYVLAARARGIPERRVVYGHALKNAFIPVLTMLGLQFAALLAGAILTETTFSWPGMGRLLVERIYLRDYPTIQGVIVMFAFFVSIVSLIVDLTYAVIDPRGRY